MSTFETGLIKWATVPSMVAAFAKAEGEVRVAFASLVESEKALELAFGYKIRIDSTHNGYHDDFEHPEVAIMRMRRDAWSSIIDRMEIRRAMSIKRYEDLMRQLKDEDPPEISEENVNAFALQCTAELPTMFDEAVKEVFNWMRPYENSRRADYKTNQKNARFELGERIVLTYEVERRFLAPGFKVMYEHQQRFIALDNVFAGLDGKGTIAKSHQGVLADAIEASGAAGVGETDYFAFRCFKNKNLHLRFKRLDLLAKFNAIAGGLNFKPEAA